MRSGRNELEALTPGAQCRFLTPHFGHFRTGPALAVVQGTAPWRSAGLLLGCRGLAEYRKTAFAAFPVSHGSGSIRLMFGQPLNEAHALNREPSVAAVGHLGADAVWPNNSLNPRLATAGTVSRAGASRTIVAVPAYSARLRSRG